MCALARDVAIGVNPVGVRGKLGRCEELCGCGPFSVCPDVLFVLKSLPVPVPPAACSLFTSYQSRSFQMVVNATLKINFNKAKHSQITVYPGVLWKRIYVKTACTLSLSIGGRYSCTS